MKAALYLRVSTADQTTDNQRRELEQVAVQRGWTIVQVYQDAAISGSKGREQRPALKQMMEDAHRKKFDLVAAWSVDRLGRSLSDLLRTSDDLRALEIQLYLHKQAVDTTTPTGRMTYQILGAVAEWERCMIRDRIDAGIARAMAAGVKFGRRKVLTEAQELDIRKLYGNDKSMAEISALMGIPKSTVARTLRAAPTEEWLG